MGEVEPRREEELDDAAKLWRDRERLQFCSTLYRCDNDWLVGVVDEWLSNSQTAPCTEDRKAFKEFDDEWGHGVISFDDWRFALDRIAKPCEDEISKWVPTHVTEDCGDLFLMQFKAEDGEVRYYKHSAWCGCEGWEDLDEVPEEL